MSAVNSMDTTAPDIEAHVLRFGNLAGKESSYRPIDMILERFERKRYPVLGRPAEQKGPPTPLDQVEAFNITYLKVEPGKGLATHGHQTPEAFIVMAGTWKITMGMNAEQETILEPFDIISVPPNEMHGAKNIGEETGWLMTINAGHGGAKLFWPKGLVEELRATGADVSDVEIPGETIGN
ncbi:cupin domain-containing protein [Alphaproteobacteria bacterium]|nr:cupin domain-containing protein [Alphaproteobacteria bacterium]